MKSSMTLLAFFPEAVPVARASEYPRQFTPHAGYLDVMVGAYKNFRTRGGSSVAILILLLILAIMAPPASAQVTSVVKVLATPNPVVLSPVTFTAGVNWTAAAAPTGTITITDTVMCAGASTPTEASLGTITLGSATSATPGAGTLVVSTFPCVGSNLIVAIYSGDSNYSPGASQPLLETVLEQFTATTATLSSSQNPSAVGQSVRFTAQLQFSLTNKTYPTGTVTFKDTSTGNVLGTADVQTSGGGLEKVTLASITTSSLAGGSHAVQATYSGNNLYAPSTSQILNQVLSGASSGPPAIQKDGLVTANQFGKFTSIAPGTWIEIYGSNLAANTRSWAGADFHGVNAPVSLDGTSLTIGGQPAFIDYISPGQVNAQVPSNVAPGSQQVIVTTAAGTSTAYSVTVNQRQPGLLAPGSFAVGGKQYVAALFPDRAYVLPPGAVSGINSRRAKPGDIISVYGIGFGTVTPDIPAGQIVQQRNTLSASMQVSFGDTSAELRYSGLAPQYIGLYQFNVVVPHVAASDAVPLTFTLGGVSGTQTLYIAVEN